MSKPHFLAIALAISLACCHNNKQKSIQTAPAFKQSPLDSAYAAIRPAIQTSIKYILTILNAPSGYPIQ